jgi:hypothetical protein
MSDLYSYFSLCLNFVSRPFMGVHYSPVMVKVTLKNKQPKGKKKRSIGVETQIVAVIRCSDERYETLI